MGFDRHEHTWWVRKGQNQRILRHGRREFSSSNKQDIDRDQRPHKVDKIYDAKAFEDETSQVVDNDASEIRNSED